MTQEEKAKAYDEAIKVANKYKDTHIMFPQIKDEIFPELKESGDERIRKNIKIALMSMEDNLVDFYSTHHTSQKELLSWLEKQGESYTKKDVDDAYFKGISDAKNDFEKQYEANYQIRKDIGTFIFNHSGIKDRAKWMDYLGVKVSFVENQGEQNLGDKVEPKFKVGDWCIDIKDGTIFQIIKVLSKTYTYKTNDGKEYSCTHYSLENDARLWSIADAKDGDVLVSNSSIFIFNCEYAAGKPEAYCGVINGKFYNGEGCWTNEKCYPATEEQRDLLFKKMKEAGYEWDAEKKELKHIAETVNGEDYGIDGLWHAKNILEQTLGEVDGYQTDDGILEHKAAICAVNSLYERKLDWSEEDEKYLQELIEWIDCFIDDEDCGDMTYDEQT